MLVLGVIAQRERPTGPRAGRPAVLRASQTRLVWRKRRWRCADDECAIGSWTEEDRRIAAPRMAMTDRAWRWVTEQVGRHARSVNEVAEELGCDWHTVNDAVVAYGTALVDDDPGRFGDVEALGLDEVLFVRLGPWHRQEFSTSIVDVGAWPAPRRRPWSRRAEPKAWLERSRQQVARTGPLRDLDLSGPYEAVFDTMLPEATQVADPFHVVKLANAKLDECRRRVQNETMGHRGRKDDPLYRCRGCSPRPTSAWTSTVETKLLGPAAAGDPTATSRRRGTRKRPSARSTATPTPSSRPQWIDGSSRTWPTRTSRSKCARSGAPPALEAPDRGVAPRALHQRADRGGQQLDQAREARGLRLHGVPELPGQVTALRGQAQLGPARDDQTPLKSEDPIWVAGNTFMVNGHRQPYIRNSRSESRRVERALSAKMGRT